MPNIKRIILLGLLVSGAIFSTIAQKNNTPQIFNLDVRVPVLPVRSNHLKMGGSNPQGDSFEVNNFYISKNGKPIIPITGEFHFSRYPEAYWEEAIQKMKAGGINMMATYVFWNIHEEIEGTFEWDGNRNVRKFIKLCAEYELPVIIRIGPFGHGEIRNGGLPDWLLAKPLTIRSNHPQYLFYVERLYREIGKQLEGLFFKDNGPIIGTQLENEYQHSAAPWGLTYPGQPLDYTSSERDKALTKNGVGVSETENPYAELGNEHMQVLKALAQDAGIITPIYTATGWGNGAIIPNETIPVTAAYPYPSWTKEPDLSPFYLYKNMHTEPDYSPVRYIPEDYPVFAAELGGGIMATYSRRPVVPANSLDAMINRCLGSGANGLGYYMYHGGSTPRGKNSFFSDEAFGAPKISYDFQAPIGEFGQVRGSFHRLKILHNFINAFSTELAPMQLILPENAVNLKPSNISDLRYAVRVKEDAGFIFLNNFQDDTVSTPKRNIQIRLRLENKTLAIPETGGVDLNSDENAIFPFNFDLGGINLNYATAQLMTRFENSGKVHFVFFSPEGVVPQFSLSKTAGFGLKEKNGIQIEQNDERWLIKGKQGGTMHFGFAHGNRNIEVLVIPKEKALKSWVVPVDNDFYLVFTDAMVLPKDGVLQLHNKSENSFTMDIYPKLSKKPALSLGEIELADTNSFYNEYQITVPEVLLNFTSAQLSPRRLVLDFADGIPVTLNNVFVELDYLADSAMGFYDNELVVDQLYKGLKWEIGLRELINQKSAKAMNFYFRPIFKNAEFLKDLENPFDFENTQSLLEIYGVKYIPEYKTQMILN